MGGTRYDVITILDLAAYSCRGCFPRAHRGDPVITAEKDGAYCIIWLRKSRKSTSIGYLPTQESIWGETRQLY